MQKCIILFSIAACALLASCKKHDGNNNGPQGPLTTRVSVALLKVDYQTHQFEGAKILAFNVTGNIPQTLPVQVNYIPPGDFGNITLLHAPGADTIFDGSIVWNGTGSMKYPAALDLNVSAIPVPVPTPDSNDVQIISPEPVVSKADYHIPQVWDAVSRLDVTKTFMQTGNKKVSLFLYTPSVGIGNPADWDYFWLLYPGPVAMPNSL